MIEKLRNICRVILSNRGADFDGMNGDSRLAEDVGLDSVSMLLLAIAIEDEFDIEIPTAAAARCVTVNDFIALIEAQK